MITKEDEMDTFETIMMAWEEGSLDDEDTVTLFQALINNGMAWTLQGCYGRFAAGMIENGLCHAPSTTN
jgi:hypothetical protein